METTATGQSNPDVINDDLDLKENITEPVEGEVKEGEVQSDTVTDGTAPENADALKLEEAKNAYKYREERRKREAIEKELADTKARLSVTPTEKPELPDYGSYEEIADYNKAMAEYHEKLTDWKLEQRDSLNSQKDAQKQVYERIRQFESDYNEQVDEAITKYPDYIEKVEKTMFTDSMQEAIFKSDNKTEIAYHLANNPDLNNKLLNASPVDTAIEISKLDMRITHSLKSKKTSSAPNPINPLKGNDIVKKDVSKMSAGEYYDAKKAGLIK